MPYIDNEGIRIYFETEGEGPPLVMAHGVNTSLESWRQHGYVDALKGEYRLILFDVRGHGKSDKPVVPEAYQFKVMVGDVIAILDELGLDKAHYLGISMGAGLGLSAARNSPNRFASFILGGISPYQGEEVRKMLEEGTRRMEAILKDPEAFFAAREQRLGRPLTAEEKSALVPNDLEAMIARGKGFLSGTRPTDSDLAAITQPCLIYCGELDPLHSGAIQMVSHMPNARFVSLPGVDHNGSLIRSDLVLPHIKKFLAEISV